MGNEVNCGVNRNDNLSSNHITFNSPNNIRNGKHNFNSQILVDHNIYTGEMAETADNLKYNLYHNKKYYVMDGIGTLKIVNGSLYKGNFLNGDFHNNGEFIYPDGCTYKGNFVNGKREGKGILVTKAYTYEGEFVNDIKNGYGLLDIKAKGKYKGLFKNGYISGYGEFIFNNNVIYKGEWSSGLFDGTGVINYTEKIYYKGQFKNGLKLGKGKLYYYHNNKNSKIEGLWEFDEYKGSEITPELQEVLTNINRISDEVTVYEGIFI